MNYDVETLLKEISDLKSRLLYYEQYYQLCVTGRQLSPPPDEGQIHKQTECSLVPASTGRYFSTTDDVSDPQNTTDSPDGPPITANGLTIITFEPYSFEHGKAKSKTKSPQQESQWRTVADQLVAKVPDGIEWYVRKESLGLRSAKDNIFVVRSPWGVSVDNHHLLFETRPDLVNETVPDEYSDNPQETNHGLIALANAYAWMTKSSQVRATCACLLKSFQELIFISLCVVLEHNGTELALIDKAMRMCISDTDPRNLERLQSGAVWANRLIIDLAKAENGWDGSRATEMVLLCGFSVSKYGILSASGHSLAYLSGRLRTSKYTEPGSGILCGGPFSIPAFIKVLLGDILTMEDICAALYYPQSFSIEQDRLSSWYKNVLNSSEVRPGEGNTCPKKRKLNTHQTISGPEIEYSLFAPQTTLPNQSSRVESGGATPRTDANNTTGRELEHDIDETESRERADYAQLDIQQERREMVNTSSTGNTLAQLQSMESQTEVLNNTLNAGNNPFDYNNAYDLNTIAFDYTNAYDLTSIAFDYTTAFDLTSIAFNDDTAYNFPAL